MPSEELLNITQAAKILGVSVKTLQRWDKEGTFPALRTPSNRRAYGVEIEWVEESLPKSYEDELVEDLISIMSSFSAKIYGRRSAMRRKRDAASRKTSNKEKS